MCSFGDPLDNKTETIAKDLKERLSMTDEKFREHVESQFPETKGAQHVKINPSQPRSTYTFAELELSAAAYDEISAKLKDAGYDHFTKGGPIDMHGIGVIPREPVVTPGQPLPKYRSHKEVRALQIKRVGQRGENGFAVDFENGLTRIVAYEVFNRYKPVPGDYLVIYADNYESFSPKKAFEDGYTRL
jgi:hypothetical protein